ncbi:MAG: cytochrome c family protein [Xanthobacteraceae bacterium]
MRHLIVALAGLGVLLGSSVAACAGGDAAKGTAVFKSCSLCHNIKAGEPNKIGPNLHGLFEREAGKAPGFSYSPGLTAATFKWDDDKLNKWLTKPQDFIAGAKMPFAVADVQDRANVIAYLHQAAEAP